jgi:hypothetical protein
MAVISWRAHSIFGPIFGQEAPEVTYESPAGRFTLPTVDTTAGTLGTDYELAQFAFGIKTYVPQVEDLAGDTGNGFSDSYSYDNLDAFQTLAQPANLVGDLDSLDPKNEIRVGGVKINPGFRFIHIGRNAMIWSVGSPLDDTLTEEVTVFPSIDHLSDLEFESYGPNAPNPPPNGIGNVILEALEFTVFGTSDVIEAKLASEITDYFGVGGTGRLPNPKWVRATLTRVYTDGYKDFNGLSPLTAVGEDEAMSGPSPQEGDDFASQWQFRDASGSPVQVKYVAVYANRTRDERFYRPDDRGIVPGDFAPSNEAEIDAVGFKRYVKPELKLIGASQKPSRLIAAWFGSLDRRFSIFSSIFPGSVGRIKSAGHATAR